MYSVTTLEGAPLVLAVLTVTTVLRCSVLGGRVDLCSKACL